MEFTSKDIKDNRLNILIRASGMAVRSKVIDNYLHNVYDTEKVITMLEHKIANHSPNVSKYVTVWEGYIKELKELSSKCA